MPRLRQRPWAPWAAALIATALASSAAADGGTETRDEDRTEPSVAPTSRAAARVTDTVSRIGRTMRATRYQHHRVVSERRGEYFWDCSGMVQWVLERAARRSALDLGGRRPLAIDFVHRIQRAPTDRFRGGWRRLPRMAEVRPGDVFAWRRPEAFESRNTGHVGFVVEAPRRVHPEGNVYLVRVADASRYTHQDDSRPWPGPGGFGYGSIAFVVDDEDRPVGYAWHGLHSRGYWTTDVVFGRVGP